MSHINSSILAHMSVGTPNFSQALDFYDRVLSCLGISRIFETPGVNALAFGRTYPEFWLQEPCDGKASLVGIGRYIAFSAMSVMEVDDFYASAINAGAVDASECGAGPSYNKACYACTVKDLDGHKIEVSFWDKNKVLQTQT